MNRKFGILLFLGLFYLVPVTYTAPFSSEALSEVNTDMKSFLERLTLAALLLIEFSVLNKQILDESPTIFNKVLNDPRVLEVKTETMENLTSILRDYAAEIVNSQKENNETRIAEVITEYSNIVDRFDSTKQRILSNEATIIGKSLKENGGEEIEKAIRLRYEIFFVKFSEEVDRYIKELNENERANEEELIEWHKKFKAEQDVNKKIEELPKLPAWRSV